MPTTDQRFMGVALALAKRGLGRTAPNPAVGAVIVRPGSEPLVVARGWTQPGGRPHAEAMALDIAGDDARGATLYVTLEPCSHHGRTPPCVDAIIAAGIARVVCATGDPDPRVSGKGIERLTDAGIDLSLGCCSQEADWLNRGHSLRVTKQRPFVQLKIAVGADGLLAPGDGQPVWVTGDSARAQSHLLRARADAVLVGSGTVSADDPDLTCRLPGMEGRSPIRIVLDGGARTSPDARLFSRLALAPIWIICNADADKTRREALEAKGARVIECGTEALGRIDLGMVLEILAQNGITRLMVEGGPCVARSFFDHNLIDEAVFATGNKPVGNQGLRPFVDDGLDLLTNSEHFRLHNERRLGADRIAVYRRI